MMVSSSMKSVSLIGNRNAKIQFFAILSFSITNSHLRSKLLVVGDWLTIRMYHLRYTQEFQNRFLDETIVFLKESSILQNIEEGHLAYSYPKKPYVGFDILARLL